MKTHTKLALTCAILGSLVACVPSELPIDQVKEYVSVDVPVADFDENKDGTLNYSEQRALWTTLDAEGRSALAVKLKVSMEDLNAYFADENQPGEIVIDFSGLKGDTGEAGADGEDGQDGQDGVDGTNGQDGVDGTNGQDGADGKDGQDGAAGADGKDGQDGVDGKDGQDGVDGKDGATGATGEKGDTGSAYIDPNLEIIIEGARKEKQLAQEFYSKLEVVDIEYDYYFDPETGHSKVTPIEDKPRRSLTEYELETIGDLAAAHARGWTGEDVDIVIVDVFNDVNNNAQWGYICSNYWQAHGCTVKEYIDSVAPDSNLTFHEIGYVDGSGDIKSVYLDQWVTDGKDIANLSYGGMVNTDGLDSTIEEDKEFIEYIDDLNAVTSLKGFETLIPEITNNYWDASENSYANLTTIAAGNDAALCDTFSTCNYIALINVSNDARDYNPEAYEDSTNATIVVGASNAEGTDLASYSNHAGLLKDHFIVAPSLPLFDEYYEYDSLKPDEEVYYDVLQEQYGTSFSAPLVAGTAALLMDKYDITAGDTIANILFATADDLGEAGVDAKFGHGMLNVGNALSPLGAIN